MRRFLIKISLFVLLFGVSNFLFLKVIQNFDWNFSKLIEIDSFENKDYDFLIIGNSLALDAFDMKFLKEKKVHAYNTAIAGATIKTNLIQLEDYLSKNKPPKAIIQGLSSYRNTDFNSEIIHPSVEFIYKDAKWSYKELPMIKFKWMAVEFLKLLISKDHRNAEFFDGQLRTLKTVADQTKLAKNITSKIDLSRYEEAHYLASIDSICLEHHIKLINIEMPGYFSTQNNAPIGPIKYVNLNNQNTSFYNLNNAEFCKIFDPKTDWLGDSHLNLYGSQKFTKYLFSNGFFEL